MMRGTRIGVLVIMACFQLCVGFLYSCTSREEYTYYVYEGKFIRFLIDADGSKRWIFTRGPIFMDSVEKNKIGLRDGTWMYIRHVRPGEPESAGWSAVLLAKGTEVETAIRDSGEARGKRGSDEDFLRQTVRNYDDLKFVDSPRLASHNEALAELKRLRETEVFISEELFGDLADRVLFAEDVVILLGQYVSEGKMSPGSVLRLLSQRLSEAMEPVPDLLPSLLDTVVEKRDLKPEELNLLVNLVMDGAAMGNQANVLRKIMAHPSFSREVAIGLAARLDDVDFGERDRVLSLLLERSDWMPADTPLLIEAVLSKAPYSQRPGLIRKLLANRAVGPQAIEEVMRRAQHIPYDGRKDIMSEIASSPDLPVSLQKQVIETAMEDLSGSAQILVLETLVMNPCFADEAEEYLLSRIDEINISSDRVALLKMMLSRRRK